MGREKDQWDGRVIPCHTRQDVSQYKAWCQTEPSDGRYRPQVHGNAPVSEYIYLTHELSGERLKTNAWPEYEPEAAAALGRRQPGNAVTSLWPDNDAPRAFRFAGRPVGALSGTVPQWKIHRTKAARRSIRPRHAVPVSHQSSIDTTSRRLTPPSWTRRSHRWG